MVEPDRLALPYLLANRQTHRCNFHVVQGVVGTRTLTFRSVATSATWDGYSGVALPLATSLREQYRARKRGDADVTTVAFREIEQRIGVRFDVALIDCEGCISTALSPPLARQLKMILWEEDGSSPVENRRWYARLVKYGFELLWRMFDTFDPDAEWSRKQVHSVWVRPERVGRRLPTCHEYAAKNGLKLRCTSTNLHNRSSLARDRGVYEDQFARSNLSRFG